MSDTRAVPTTVPTAEAPKAVPAAGRVLQRACACGRHSGNGGECAECRKKRLGLQRRSVGQGPDVAPPIVHDVLRSPGRPLDEGTRGFMESRFGQDFSGVRVHTDARAAESARAVNALAYTVGNHVAFGAGQFAPGTSGGRGLLAHELAHTIQQTGQATAGGVLRIDAPDSTAEQESCRAAIQIGRGGPAARVSPLPHGSVLARQPADDTGSDEDNDDDGLWETIAGGLLGEWNEDPSFAMIGVDLGVSLIPILDQASDVRDIAAHLYYLTIKGQYNRFMRWLGLAFTLIGVVPEFGSLIKGASKFVIRGVRKAIAHLGDILRPFLRYLDEIADFGALYRFISRNWDRWKGYARHAWEFLIGLLQRTVNRAVSAAAGIGSFISSAFSAVTSFAVARLGRVSRLIQEVRERAPGALNTAFNWARQRWDEVAEWFRKRFASRGDSTDEAGDVVTRTQRVRVTNQHLLEWERAGGHAIQRHGPFHTRETLLQRLFNETRLGGMPPPGAQLPGGQVVGSDYRLWQGNRVPDASAWVDESVMLDSMTRIINDNIDTIHDVTSRGGTVVMEGVELGQNVGRGWVTALRGQAGTGERGIYWSEELRRATVVIRPKPGGGWFVFTAYPHM